MIPQLLGLVRLSFNYLAKKTPKLVAGVKASSSPKAWNSAIGAMTAKGMLWTAKHPFLATAIATVGMYTPELADKIESYWSAATGGAVTTAEDALEFGSKSPEKQALILAGFAAAGIPPEAIMQRLEGESLTDDDKALMRNLNAIYASGDDKVIVSATGFGGGVMVPTSELEHHINVINQISNSFSVRSADALVSLSNTLEAFSLMSESEIRTAHRVKQL